MYGRELEMRRRDDIEPNALGYLILGILRLDEQPDGQLQLLRWRRKHHGMGWESVPYRETAFNDLPGGAAWQQDLRMACGWEISQAERAAGRDPNEGCIHGYVNRCLDAFFAVLREAPAWRTLGSRILAVLNLDPAARRRARALLRWDRATRPCSLYHYNLARRYAHLFDDLAAEQGTFACAELVLGAWLEEHGGEDASEPLTRLRRDLLDLGRHTIRPSTWRLLLRMTPRHLYAMEPFYRGSVWPQLVDFLLCLERCWRRQ